MIKSRFEFYFPHFYLKVRYDISDGLDQAPNAL